MLSLIKDFGENYDQVLFQKETVLWGSGKDADSPSSSVESAGSDDD